LSGVARGALWAVFTVCAFLCADSLLFRAGWYNAYLEPDSSAGSLESQLHWLRTAHASPVPEVLAVGDSRVAEGFSSRIAQAAAGGRLHFRNFGQAGTTPRVWYYALRDGDPTRRRFAAIVLALDNYSDADRYGLSEDRILDENFLAMRLGLGDCADFASSFDSTALRHTAFFNCLFRGILLRQDVRAFLAHPIARIRHARDWWKNGLGYQNNYGGKSGSLRGLSVDWASGTIQFPDGVSEDVQANVRRFVLLGPGEDSRALTRYRERWLGGIVDMYKDSPTRLIFLRLPRGPVVRPDAEQPAGFVDSAARLPKVTVLPAETFTDLERPEVFADALHLNREGRPIFSTRLGEKVESVLAGGGR